LSIDCFGAFCTPKPANLVRAFFNDSGLGRGSVGRVGRRSVAGLDRWFVGGDTRCDGTGAAANCPSALTRRQRTTHWTPHATIDANTVRHAWLQAGAAIGTRVIGMGGADGRLPALHERAGGCPHSRTNHVSAHAEYALGILAAVVATVVPEGTADLGVEQLAERPARHIAGPFGANGEGARFVAPAYVATVIPDGTAVLRGSHSGNQHAHVGVAARACL